MGDVWLIGAGINLVGSIAINFGTNLMKLHHLQESTKQAYVSVAKQAESAGSSSAGWTDMDVDSDTAVKMELRPRSDGSTRTKEEEAEGAQSNVWLTGILFFTLGNMMNFASMGFAAQSLLAALGSVQFVSNVFFQWFVLHQLVSPRVVAGTLTIVVGNAFIVTFADHTDRSYTVEQLQQLYVGRSYILFMVCIGVLVAILSAVSATISRAVKNDSCNGRKGSCRRLKKLLPFCYVGVSAMVGTQSVTFAKSCAVLIRSTVRGHNQMYHLFSLFIILMWGLTMAFWMYRLNVALQRYNGLFIIPLLQVSWTVCSIVGGGIYFGEFTHFSMVQTAMFTLGVTTVFCGIVWLTPSDPHSDEGAAVESLIGVPNSPLVTGNSPYGPDNGVYTIVIDRCSPTSSEDSYGSQPSEQYSQWCSVPVPDEFEEAGGDKGKHRGEDDSDSDEDDDTLRQPDMQVFHLQESPLLRGIAGMGGVAFPFFPQEPAPRYDMSPARRLMIQARTPVFVPTLMLAPPAIELDSIGSSSNPFVSSARSVDSSRSPRTPLHPPLRDNSSV